jgi:enoyl-CoA hydratase/carnithine racemase
MPETAIGFFPDVGATWFLSRAPNEMGAFLGLSGYRIGPTAAHVAGLVDTMLPRSAFKSLIEALSTASSLSLSSIQKIIDQFSVPFAPDPWLNEFLPWCQSVFSAASVEEIWQRLNHESPHSRERGNSSLKSVLSPGRREREHQIPKGGSGNIPLAQWLIEYWPTYSPTSLKVTLQALRYARTLSFDECLAMEYRVACRMMQSPDFFTGVRARLIDKQGLPAWQPPCLEAVTEEEIARYFSS